MNIQKLFLPIPHLSDDKNQKWTFQSFVFILSLLCHHTLYYTIELDIIFLFYGANIRIIPETCKHFGNYFDYGDGDRGGSDHPWPLLT